MDIVDSAKAVYDIIVIPVIGIVGFILRQHISTVKELEVRGINNSSDIKVLQSQLEKLEKDIDEIKEGINKLLDRSMRK